MPTCSENSFALFKMLAKHSRKCSLTFKNCFENISECSVENTQKVPNKIFQTFKIVCESNFKFVQEQFTVFRIKCQNIPKKTIFRPELSFKLRCLVESCLYKTHWNQYHTCFLVGQHWLLASGYQRMKRKSSQWHAHANLGLRTAARLLLRWNRV